MSKHELQVTFDYEAREIDKSGQRSLENHAAVIIKEIDHVRRLTVEGVFKIAERLQKAHDELANHKSGTFGKWVEGRCGMSRMSAYRMMQARTAFIDERYRNTVLQYFDPSALYLLSADSCPENTTKKALRLAENGEHITKKRAQDLIGKPDSPTRDEQLDSAIDTVRRIVRRFEESDRKGVCELLIQILEEMS